MFYFLKWYVWIILAIENNCTIFGTEVLENQESRRRAVPGLANSAAEECHRNLGAFCFSLPFWPSVSHVSSYGSKVTTKVPGGGWQEAEIYLFFLLFYKRKVSPAPIHLPSWPQKCVLSVKQLLFKGNKVSTIGSDHEDFPLKYKWPPSMNGCSEKGEQLPGSGWSWSGRSV